MNLDKVVCFKLVVNFEKMKNIVFSVFFENYFVMIMDFLLIIFCLLINKFLIVVIINN